MSEEKELNIGALLRQKREERKFSIKEVALKLKVKTSYIEFLEAENFAAFDKNFYTKALIKSYAKLLKINDLSIEEKLKENFKNENNRKIKKGEGLIFEDKNLSPNLKITYKSAICLAIITLILLGSFGFSKNRNFKINKTLSDFYEKNQTAE